MYMFCLSFCPLSFDHYVFCPASLYGLWLPCWYLQTLLNKPRINPVATLAIFKLHQQSIVYQIFVCTYALCFLLSFLTLCIWKTLSWPQMWVAMIRPFRAKHMNDDMCIEDLVTWRHFNVILENNNVMLISL